MYVKAYRQSLMSAPSNTVSATLPCATPNPTGTRTASPAPFATTQTPSRTATRTSTPVSTSTPTRSATPTVAPRVEEYNLSAKNMCSESWVDTGFGIQVNTNDAKWGGRPVKLKTYVQVTTGQHLYFRVYNPTDGTSYELGFAKNQSGPFGNSVDGDHAWWYSNPFVLATGSRYYVLQIHGNVGWDPCGWLNSGTFTLYTEAP